MRPTQKTGNRLRHFNHATDGAVSVEFVLAMPILFWAFAACFVFFDGYRQSAVNLKAAYTISDMISRETAGIDENYIDSLQKLMTMMARSGSDTALRVTIVRWSEDTQKYYVDWSVQRGYPSVLTNTDVSDMKNRLPTMADEERVIVVETSNTFTPTFRVGLDEKQLTNFVFTRPRFSPQVAWAGDDFDPDDGVDNPDG